MQANKKTKQIYQKLKQGESISVQDWLKLGVSMDQVLRMTQMISKDRMYEFLTGYASILLKKYPELEQ